MQNATIDIYSLKRIGRIRDTGRREVDCRYRVVHPLYIEW